MWIHCLAAMVTGRLLSLAGAAPAPCPPGTVSMLVTTPAEVQDVINTINCTGQGWFDVYWAGSVQLIQTIELSENKELTITGTNRVSTDVSRAVIDAGSLTGLFSVSNGSTLILNNLVLEGGISQEGAAIDARSSSSVKVAGCAFTNNNATTGGAIYADMSKITIDGDTVFTDNSAQDNGGAIFAKLSEVNVDANITFQNNYAGNDGGAVYADMSEVNIAGESHFGYNSVAALGGAIFSTNSNVSVDGHSSFTKNSAGGGGGGLYVLESVVFLSGESDLRYNSAQGHAGVIRSLRSTIYIDGNYSFVNNSATGTGGAVYAAKSEIYLTGTTSFSNNSAEDKGGAVAWLTSEVTIAGDTSFGYNTAQTRGGALFSGISDIRWEGRTWFGFNSAVLSGGAVQAHTTTLNMEGYTGFTNNSAAEDGGAINIYTEGVIDIAGTAIFSYNSAVWRGGAIHLISSECAIRGTTSFVNNTGYDGGAIVAQQSPVHVDGNTSFVSNSAEHDGGAMSILGANATIMGKVDFVSNTAQNGGALHFALNPLVEVVGKAHFIGNKAAFYGGALVLTDPVEVYIDGTTFESNTGASGGAVSLTSTEGTTGGFNRCRFEGNDATNGGALYMGPGDKGETEKTRHIQDSVFVNNIADDFGGALFNAGELEIGDSVFSENTAGEGGLAIHDEGSSAVLRNVTFHDNMFSCPDLEYSDAHHESRSACRFEVVCSQCSEGCNVNESVATVTTDTIPTCERIPEGVHPSLTATLETFYLMKGYYRVSAESRVIRECYQMDACSGGTDGLNYCATGYVGPYCAVCDEGYASGVLNRCHACSTIGRHWSMGLAITALVLVLFVASMVVLQNITRSQDDARRTCPTMVRSWYRSLVKGLPLSAIKIAVVVLQIITQFTEIAGAVYPDEYEAFLVKLSVINLDIGFILSNSCIVHTNFYARLLVATIGPPVVLALLFGTLFIAGNRQRTIVTASPDLHQKRASTALFILFFVYSSSSFAIFQTFVCDELDDGISYLRADYSLLCTSDKHAAYTLYASVMVCIYPVGIPVFFAWWLARNRQDLQNRGRVGLARLQAFRGLWDAYSPSCYYFEVVECFRRIVLTGAAVFVLPNSAEQIAIIFLLAVVFTFISESLSPFASKADMWLYRLGNAIILASMYVALLLKAELTDEDSSTSTFMTGLLISANIFLMVTVGVQAALLVRGVYVARRLTALHPSPCVVSFVQQSTAIEPAT